MFLIESDRLKKKNPPVAMTSDPELGERAKKVARRENRYPVSPAN
jgi:hypothetical protein